MKRKKFNQLLFGIGLGTSLLPHYLYSTKKTSNKFDYLLGKSQQHLVEYQSHLVEKQTLSAYLNMKADALREGIELSIASAFRSFERQQLIFEKKYKDYIQTSNSNLEAVQKITTYSSIPGTSRHHWGTDIDLIDLSVDLPKNDLLSEKHYLDNGVFNKMYQWMQENANRYGFVETYPNNHKQRKGFYFEPWHYSYQPVSKENLYQYTSNQLIKRVMGENILGLKNLPDHFFENYQKEFILGIHQNLLP